MHVERITLWPGREDVALTAYITPPDPAWPFPVAPRPGIVICPGGAYLMLSPSEGEPMALEFSVHGYQTFVLEYTVASAAPQGVDTRYPAALVDLARAMAVVRENSGRWFTDGDKLAVMGFSAGGHLCASYAVHWHEQWLARQVGVDSSVLRPSAALLGYPIADYVIQHEKESGELDMMIASNRTLFGTERPTREQEEALSPCRYVGEHTPPVFLAHAADDRLVPVINSLHMAAALSAAEVPFELHVFQQGEHGFACGQPMDRPWESHRARACAAWLPLARRWLLKQFAPETREAPLPSPEEFFRAGGQGC